MSEIFIPIEGNQIKSTIRNKVTIVGTGAVGMAAAYAIIMRAVTAEVCLIDAMGDKLKGDIIDLQHGEQFLSGVQIYGGSDVSLSVDSEVIIVTAGARQKEGESRLNLVQRNVDIFKQLIPNLVKYSPNCIFVIISNPVDIMTYVTWKLSGFPKSRVFGTGCLLDSARFTHMLGKKFNVSPMSVHGYVIGEHGDSSVPVWSSVNIGGVMLTKKYPKAGQEGDPDNFGKIHKDVINSAYDIIKLKGYTNWGIGTITCALLEAIVKNKNVILPVSTLAEGLHGIKKAVFLSVPCLVTSAGITHVVPLDLNEKELSMIQNSASTLHDIQVDLQW